VSAVQVETIRTCHDVMLKSILFLIFLNVDGELRNNLLSAVVQDCDLNQKSCGS